VTRVLCVGECMIEMRYLDAATARIGYAGDTYNTAVYLRRTATALGADAQVGFLTGLGSDEDSIAMRAAWAAGGVTDRSILVADRRPGLYAIRVDADGERRFSYWRDSSAARHLFTATDWIDELHADVIHLSGVTLQLATPDVRRSLAQRLTELRDAGAMISLDTNYRPSGWAEVATAAQVMDTIAGAASTVFATLEDEAALHGCATVEGAAARLAALGVPEVVVKDGARGAYVLQDGRATHVSAVPVETVVDTTAAGDAFAGGYLAARLAQRAPDRAARIAAHIAAAVIRHPGAVIDPRVPLLPAELTAGPARTAR
jgi:2-dehydro-3-deoxygluconokinase